MRAAHTSQLTTSPAVAANVHKSTSSRGKDSAVDGDRQGDGRRDRVAVDFVFDNFRQFADHEFPERGRSL